MTVCTLFVTAGQVIAYVIGWLLSTTPHGWRWMVGLGALPAAIQLVTLFFMPETPRWLVKAQRQGQARQVLCKVYGHEGRAEGVVEGILRGVERELMEEEELRNTRNGVGDSKSAGCSRFGDGVAELTAQGGNRRALIIACMLQGFQQLCGFVRSTFLCVIAMYMSDCWLGKCRLRPTCVGSNDQADHIKANMIYRTPSCTSLPPSSP